MVRIVVLATCLIGCAYDARFGDCEVACATSSSCPEGLTCGGEGLCRVSGGPATCAQVLEDAGTDGPPQFTSCIGLAATCGPGGNEDCCSSATPIPGGTFYRGYDAASDGMYQDMSHPATVSAFELDKYEVTVARFRAFVDAGMGTQVNPPIAESGAHARIPGSGWDAGWNNFLASDSSALRTALNCDSVYQSWTATPGANESLPINCVSWYEAMAFCVWDGGYLPTETEWTFAATGGNEQRAYPWSIPAASLAIDCSYTNYYINMPGTHCVNGTTGAVNRVGAESPKGDGKYGQADLGGNVWEWALDSYQSPYENPCNDCVDLTATSSRVFRGGYFGDGASLLRTAFRSSGPPGGSNVYLGIRCARSP